MAEESAAEENVITPEEFQELEKKEGKRIRIKKPAKKEKPAPPPRPVRHEPRREATDTEMLLLKTEKLEGKIEAMGEFREAVNERFSGLNQEIGELRSSILEKDRSLREVQQGFTKIREMAEGLEPEKIASQLATKDQDIEKNLAAIEALRAQVNQLRKDVKANSDTVEGIRSIKNVAAFLEKLNRKMKRIEEDRKFTSRTAGKIDTMFTDMGERLGEFQGFKDRISFNEETMHEIMKTVDMIEARLEDMPKKDDVEKLEGRVEEKIEGLRTESDDKLYDVRRLLDELLTALKEAGIKGVLERVGRANLERAFASKNDLEEVRARLDALRSATVEAVKRKQVEFIKETAPSPMRRGGPAPAPRPDRARAVIGIQDRVDSLIDQAEEAIRMGNLDMAKNRYREALSLYSQLNRAESYQEALIIYERIRKLYSRLRIYT